MTLNDILINDELNKLLNNSIGKTYNKYKINMIMDKEDFYQDTCIFLMNRIEKFNNEKSSIKTYLPLLVMTSAKRCIEKARGQSKENDKLNFHKNILSLDVGYGSESDANNLINSITSKNNDLESNSINNLFIDEIVQSKILSDRQSRIIELMQKGYTKTDISRILNCTQSNINIHFKKAKEKILMNYTY